MRCWLCHRLMRTISKQNWKKVGTTSPRRLHAWSHRTNSSHQMRVQPNAAVKTANSASYTLVLAILRSIPLLKVRPSSRSSRTLYCRRTSENGKNCTIIRPNELKTDQSHRKEVCLTSTNRLRNPSNPTPCATAWAANMRGRSFSASTTTLCSRATKTCTRA